MKTLFLLFLASSTAHANSLTLKLLSSPGLTSGFDRGSDELQIHKGLAEYHVESDFVFTNGFAVGVGYSTFDIRYKQKQTTSRNESTFNSQFNFPYLRLAKYFKSTNNNFFFDVGLRYGTGELKLENNSTKTSKNKHLGMIGGDLNLNYLIYNKITLIAGLGFWKRTGTEINIDNYRFSEKEMDIKTVHFNFGIGVLFD